MWHRQSIPVLEECVETVPRIQVKVPFGWGKFYTSRLHNDTNRHIRRIRLKRWLGYKKILTVRITIMRNNTIFM